MSVLEEAMSNDHSSPVQEGQEETGATLSTQERISPIIFTITILRLGHSLRVKAYVYSIA